MTPSQNPRSIPANSTNIIGLVPGKHVRFNRHWDKDFGPGLVTDNAPIQTTGDVLHISASIIALQGGTNAAGVWEHGTEFWDLTTTEEYNYVLYGNHIDRVYRIIKGNPNTGCRGAGGWSGWNSFLVDTRMSKDNLQPPGYPNLRTQNGLNLLTVSNWTEESFF